MVSKCGKNKKQKWQVCHALMLLPHSEVLQIKQPTIARPTQPRTSDTAKRNKSAGSRNLCSHDSRKIAISGNGENYEK